MRWLGFFAGLVLLCAPGGPGRAQPGRGNGNNDEEFRRHYARGAQLYRQEKFADAIREFLAAYTAKQLPRVLFDLGQAHRRLGHAREALGFYELYVEVEPDLRPEVVTELERNIGQLRAQIYGPHEGERRRDELAPPPPPGVLAQRPQAGIEVLDPQSLPPRSVPATAARPAGGK